MIVDMASLDWCSSRLLDDPLSFVLFPDEYSQDFLALTPPQSPEHESDAVDLSEYMTNSSTTGSHCRCRYPIVRDCMWSENFAVRIPDAIGRTNSFDKCNDIEISSPSSSLDFSKETTNCSRCVGLDTSMQCVDMRSVFNYLNIPAAPISSTISTSTKMSSYSNHVKEEMDYHHVSDEESVVVKTEVTSDFEESFGSLSSSDDDCEVDVEYVSDCPSDDPMSDVPVIVSKKMLVLPAATSASAHVAVMHNYSSMRDPTMNSHRLSSSSSCHRSSKNSKSASQSPNIFPSVMKIRRFLSSNPTSPSSRRHKRSLGSRGGDRRPYTRRDSTLLTPPGSSDSEGELNRRALHNVLERKRRNNLKEYFNVLRDQIPRLRIEQRSSKVVILQRAKEWVNELCSTERRYQQELQRQRAYHDELMRRIMASHHHKSPVN